MEYSALPATAHQPATPLPLGHHIGNACGNFPPKILCHSPFTSAAITSFIQSDLSTQTPNNGRNAGPTVQQQLAPTFASGTKTQ